MFLGPWASDKGFYTHTRQNVWCVHMRIIDEILKILNNLLPFFELKQLALVAYHGRFTQDDRGCVGVDLAVLVAGEKHRWLAEEAGDGNKRRWVGQRLGLGVEVAGWLAAEASSWRRIDQPPPRGIESSRATSHTTGRDEPRRNAPDRYTRAFTDTFRHQEYAHRSESSWSHGRRIAPHTARHTSLARQSGKTS